MAPILCLDGICLWALIPYGVRERHRGPNPSICRPLLASHSNCRTLVPGQRQFDDHHLQTIISRGGVIGAALDAWMLQSNWIRGETTNENLTLEAVADHIDHVCQLAGNSLHAAIGSDLDGGYGTEQTPRDLDTIADLQKIPGLLKKRAITNRTFPVSCTAIGSDFFAKPGVDF